MHELWRKKYLTKNNCGLLKNFAPFKIQSSHYFYQFCHLAVSLGTDMQMRAL